MKNIAFIGFGGMAGYHLARTRTLSDYFRVVGGYDIDAAALERVKKEGLKAYDSYEAVAADPEVDTVLIATPNDVHLFYIDYFARAKKNILCEKPVTLNAAEFDAACKVAAENGVIFEVNQNGRLDADYDVIKKVIQSGKLGKINRIESRVTGANGVPGGWRKRFAYGGGMMLDWGIHLFDQLLNMGLGKVTALSCEYDYVFGFEVDDRCTARLCFDSGVVAIMQVDTNCFVAEPRWKVYGRDGTAVLKNWELEGEIVTPVYGTETEIVGIDAGNGFTKTMAYRPHDSENRESLPAPDSDGDLLYKKFAEAKCQDDVLIPLCEVARTMRILDLCAESAKENGKLIKEVE